MNRRVIIALVALVMLILGAVIGFVAGGAIGRSLIAQKPVPAEAERAPPPNPDLFYDMPQILVALAGSDESDHVLRIQASLLCDSVGDKARVSAYSPRVIDVFQVYLRKLQVKDVRGPENLKKVRAELLPLINAAIAPAHVSDILFNNLVVL